MPFVAGCCVTFSPCTKICCKSPFLPGMNVIIFVDAIILNNSINILQKTHLTFFEKNCCLLNVVVSKSF